MIRKISGKNKSPSYTHLNMVGTDSKATSKTDIADTLGETFCHNSSSFNYSESFRKIKIEQEKVKLNFKSQNNEIYNKDFNLDELVEAIQLSHDSATGPDEIHYQMLKHLPDTSLETLLNIFNYIWTTGKFPESLESPYHLVAVSGAHFTQGTILIVIIVSSGSAKSRTHQSAVGGFLVTRRGWPGRLRACRIWTFINSV